jgi:cytochrome c553
MVGALLLNVGCSDKPKQETSAQATKTNPEPAMQTPIVSQVQQTQEAQVEKVFDTAEAFSKCAGCHGASGEKKALGKSEILKGQSKEMLFDSLKKYQAGTLNKTGMASLMKSQVAKYSQEELEKIAEYISKL